MQIVMAQSSDISLISQLQVLSNEELNVLTRIKDLKSQYKDQFTELQVCSSFW